ncbi:Serine/threonine protein kinase [Phytophthora megakarya]|uniref:Serine/threonine protein kinase n=1 Tax=Phytophthora megakarya TaxID=4795 RepID=A0A225W458_9STRA|nr:Serine/threonine protein kinase [Phytophthora megakarya]
MTSPLKMLASKMCGNDPNSRISAAIAVEMLEGLTYKTQLQSESKSELTTHITEYNDGDLLRQWQKLEHIASTVAIDRHEFAVFHELETLYKRLAGETQSTVLLQQFSKLISNCIGAFDVGCHLYRILRLSSTNARGQLKLCRQEQKLRQQKAFVSEVSQTLVVLNELKTQEAREAFVAFLKTEIDSHKSSYPAAQLEILKQAYIDLNASRNSKAVATMPEGFLPWYELEVDGANYLTEGGFSEIYRAKWLESEVIVKQVKLTNTTNLDSWASNSLISTTTPETRNTNQMSKQIREMFEDEVGVWFGLSHPHVVRLFGACHVGTPLFVCEFASAGSLDKYLRKHPNEMWQKLHEAALGVQYLHSRDIVHADLKCNNIVVGGDNKAKVTDFGLSSANIVTGAWHWVAPECLERGPSELSTMSDIYALGMCIVEALRIVEITTNINSMG